MFMHRAGMLLSVCTTLIVVRPAFGSEPQDGKTPHVVFVTGDCEYRSEVSMPMIARILEERHGMKCTVLYAVNTETGERQPKFYGNIPGLEALDTADLAVFFMRYRALPDDQFNRILKYAQSGKPLIGLRTTTHAFRYPENQPLSQWNDRFGMETFGQKWITHHGHTSTTRVSVIEGEADNPILRGVDRMFPAKSWLYHVEPLVGDCRPLLKGDSVDSEKSAEQRKQYPLTQPVAWTKGDRAGRVFFTTLGHPGDFEQESMRRLLVNAVYWCLGKDIPAGGTSADPVEKYVAPPTT